MTPAEALAQRATARPHEDDSYGGCVTCCEHVPYTDDEYIGVPFPCPTIRIEQAEAERDEALALLRRVVYQPDDADSFWMVVRDAKTFLRRHDAQPGGGG